MYKIFTSDKDTFICDKHDARNNLKHKTKIRYRLKETCVTSTQNCYRSAFYSDPMQDGGAEFNSEQSPVQYPMELNKLCLIRHQSGKFSVKLNSILSSSDNLINVPWKLIKTYLEKLCNLKAVTIYFRR